MTEKNRNILSNAINTMGKRSPKASNWDDIAGRLDQLDAGAFSAVKKDLPIHKAPGNAWKNITRGLPPAHFSFLGSLTGKIIFGFIIVAAITASYLLIPVKEEERTENNLEASSQVKTKLKAEAKSENQSASTATEAKRVKLAVSGSNDLLPSLPQSENMFADLPVETKDREVSPSPIIIGSIEPLPSKYSNSINIKHYGLQGRNEREAKDINPVYFDESRYQVEYSIGAYYAFSLYQQVETSGMDTPDKLSSYGIELKLEKHKWFLKTGLEYIGWEEKGTYTIDYNQNQLVYQYNYVDSANINTYSGEITYFTSEREVYDSLPGQLSDEAANSYRMLNIPILVGYKIVDRAKFSLAAIGGIGFDIRLSGKKYTPVFNEEGAVITGISSNLQYRTSNNWRLIGGIEMSYYLTRSFEIYLEPSYQQYMKPLYSNDNMKGPGSFKIKAGLRYSF
jgi:hypothetical protein